MTYKELIENGKGTINVIGIIYKVEIRNIKDDERLKDLDGYCSDIEKLIVLSDLENVKVDDKGKEFLTKSVLRHEILHAFLSECGLGGSSLGYTGAWALNEEMIDFFAYQWHKINDIFVSLNI